MAQMDTPVCGSLNAEEIRNWEVNAGGRTQSNVSAEEISNGEVNDRGRTQSNVSAGEISNGEVNDRGQTQSYVLAKSWLMQVKHMFDPHYKMWQMSSNVCIYRVPKSIIINKKEAYIPFVISFGPYHNKMNTKLSTMDQWKVEAVHRMLARLKINVTSLAAEIRTLDSKVRECYEEAIEWDEETLAWMLTMDACFILEFFRSSIAKGNCFTLVFQDDSHQNTVYWDILMDIMKVENQIPLFILTTLLSKDSDTDEGAIQKLTELLDDHMLFRGYPFDVGNNSKLEKGVVKKARHLLDLYRIVIKQLLTHAKTESPMYGQPDVSGAANNIHYPSTESAIAIETDGSGGAYNIKRKHSSRPRRTDVRQCSYRGILRCPWTTRSRNDSEFNPSADLLVKAGIEFQAGPMGFAKRRFGSGTFSLPKITVDDSTETFLRNLIAYEECQRCSSSPEQTVLSHYADLLDNLVDSEKDVSILRKSQVVESRLGSDEDIAHMFNRITKDITIGERMEEFEVVLKQGRDHYNNQWKVWMNQFKEEHFSKPWSILSFLAALFALGMTLVQTVYSIKK